MYSTKPLYCLILSISIFSRMWTNFINSFAEQCLKFLSPLHVRNLYKRTHTLRRLHYWRKAFEYSSTLHLAWLKSLEVLPWCVDWEVLVVLLLKKRHLAVTKLPHLLPAYSSYSGRSLNSAYHSSLVSRQCCFRLLAILMAVQETLQCLAGN